MVQQRNKAFRGVACHRENSVTRPMTSLRNNFMLRLRNGRPVMHCPTNTQARACLLRNSAILRGALCIRNIYWEPIPLPSVGFRMPSVSCLCACTSVAEVSRSCLLQLHCWRTWRLCAMFRWSCHTGSCVRGRQSEPVLRAPDARRLFSWNL